MVFSVFLLKTVKSAENYLKLVFFKFLTRCILVCHSLTAMTKDKRGHKLPSLPE